MLIYDTIKKTKRILKPSYSSKLIRCTHVVNLQTYKNLIANDLSVKLSLPIVIKKAALRPLRHYFNNQYLLVRMLTLRFEQLCEVKDFINNDVDALLARIVFA